MVHSRAVFGFATTRTIIGSLICAMTVVSDVGAQSGNPVTTVSRNIRGIVTDTGRVPIPNVEVILEQSAGGAATSHSVRVLTSAKGEFFLDNLNPGPGRLTVRRLGYGAHNLGVMVADSAIVRQLEIVLRRSSFDLDTIRVKAPTTGGVSEIAGAQRRRGSGHFISRADIERRRPAYVSDILRRVPGVSLRQSSGIGNVVRLRGCRPAIFMDGVQAVTAELDEVARPSDIEGIEVYGSWAGVPTQYVDRSGRSCGAILVWTRRR